MTKLYINDVEIKLEDKIALNSAFNETLDTGVVIIPNSEEIAVKRLDKAVIVNDSTNTRKYFKVGTIVKEFETFEQPFKYKYTIELVSPTIDLQSIVLPNVSITQPLEITEVPKRSIYYELDRFVKVFAPEFTISEELKALTENIECPENQYNRKTLFEIFNDLLINVPAVVTVLENNVISCIKLNQEGQEIDHSKIVNIIETKRLDEYCSEIEISAENVVEGSANTTTDIPVSPRSTEYVMTTDNAQIILDKPIYRIEKVEVLAREVEIGWNDVPDAEAEGGLYVDKFTNQLIDITKYVVEESVYNTKLPTSLIDLPLFNLGEENPDVLKYKRVFLSYAQGSNVINNLSFSEKTLFNIPSLDNALYNVLALGAGTWYKNKYPDRYVQSASIDNMLDPRPYQFIVTYISQTGLRFRVKKENTDNTNYKLIIDNQSNSYVDSQALWNVEKENVKRLGNPELKINMILKSIDEIPSVVSTFEGHVLTQSVCNIYANKIIFEGYFSKDYIRKNLYTGIKSKARWTSIAKGSEALKRQDLMLVDFEFTTEKPPIFESSMLDYIINNLTKENNKIAFSIVTKNGFTSLGGKLINKSIYKFGNNLLFSFSFPDNFNAGMKIDSIMSSQYVMAQEPYVNELGEFEKIMITFFENDIDPFNVSLTKSQNLPEYASTEKIIDRYEFLAMKDNREIYGADIQLRFSSNNSVKIKDKFVEQFSISPKEKTQKLYVFGFYNRKLNENDNNISEFMQDGEGVEFTTDFIGEYGITQPTWVGWNKNITSCWGICNENYDILLYTNTNAETLYYKKGGQRLC